MFNGIVMDLLSGGESAEQNLRRLAGMKPEPSDDCSGLLLLTLQWEVQKYGQRLQDGHRFLLSYQTGKPLSYAVDMFFVLV